VAQHRVAHRARGVDEHAAPVVAGDDVAAQGATADIVVSGPVLDIHAVKVTEGGRSHSVEADEVAPHRVARGGRAGGRHPRVAVAGDDVAAGGAAAPNQVLRGSLLDPHAEGVAEVDGAGGVQADEVAPHHVERRAGAVDVHARAGVPGDDVAGRGAASP